MFVERPAPYLCTVGYIFDGKFRKALFCKQADKGGFDELFRAKKSAVLFISHN